MRGESGNEVTNRLLHTQSKVPIIHVNGEEQNISIVVAVRVSMTINYVLPIYCYHVTPASRFLLHCLFMKLQIVQNTQFALNECNFSSDLHIHCATFVGLSKSVCISVVVHRNYSFR